MMKILPKAFSPLLLLCIVSLICSCIILPIYRPPHSPMDRIDLSSIKPGITTKEEIFLNLGNPFNRVSDDERVFTATFSSRGYSGLLVAAGAGYSAGAFTLGDKTLIDIYELEIEFDDNDLVKRWEIVLRSRKEVDQITY